eukprot:1160811-Pelagomonas_calceolata.AAC.4
MQRAPLAALSAEEGQEMGIVPATVKRPGAGAASLGVISQLLIALRLMYGVSVTLLTHFSQRSRRSKLLIMLRTVYAVRVALLMHLSERCRRSKPECLQPAHGYA